VRHLEKRLVIDANEASKKKVRQNEDTLHIIGKIASKFLDNTKERDTTFSIRVQNGNLYCGDTRIIVENENIRLFDGTTYEGMPGFWELLTLKDPKTYTQEDLKAYEDIVLKTHVYRQNNDKNNPHPKSSNGIKYLTLIQPMLRENGILKEPRFINNEPGTSLAQEIDEAEGSGLKKLLTNAPIEYVYWNSLDELLERLYIDTTWRDRS